MNGGARHWRRVAPGLSVLLSVTAAWAQGRTTTKPMQVAPGPTLPPAGPGGVPTYGAVAPVGSTQVPGGLVTVPTIGTAAAAGSVAPVGSGGAQWRGAGSEARLARLMPVPGGWTAEQAGQRARHASYDVAAKNEALRAAAAKVDQALYSFLPRLSGTARYTRLSPITAPSLGGGGGFSVAAVGSGVAAGAPLPANALLVATPPFSFPVLLNNYTLQASLTVPISDYFLRISHAYAAASHNEESARLDRLASEAKAAADGKIAFYNWVKAVGQREVLQQALEATRDHAKDAESLFKAGTASKADVLGAQSQVAQGELAVAQAQEYVELAYEQLRIAVRAKPDEAITLGEDVIAQLPRATLDMSALRQEGVTGRAELRSLAAAEQGLSSVASLSRAQSWPQVAAVGNYTYANPNQRYVPQSNTWNATWDVSLQLTWSPNDFLVGRAAGSEADANTMRLRVQSTQFRDALSLEVTQAVSSHQTADLAAEATATAVTAAEEAYRVRREMYRVGRGTSVELSDAEANLFRAKLAAVSARIDQRIARVKLEHATGRDLSRMGPR